MISQEEEKNILGKCIIAVITKAYQKCRWFQRTKYNDILRKLIFDVVCRLLVSALPLVLQASSRLQNTSQTIK